MLAQQPPAMWPPPARRHAPVRLDLSSARARPSFPFATGSELSLTSDGDGWRLRSKYEDPIASRMNSDSKAGPPGGVIDVDVIDVDAD